MDIAVIGTGPAAFAVINTLLRHPDSDHFDITLVGPSDTRPDFPLSGRDPRSWTPAEYDALHRQLKQLGGKGFPPPRTQHGSLLTKSLSSSRTTLYQTNYFGGLGEFWSTAMFPFRERDFEGWPIGYADLKPYYAQIANLVGIAGEPNAFEDRYPDSFVNRPAVQQTELARRLVQSVRESKSSVPGMTAGPNQLAVETRPGEPNACEYCGGCLYGCFKNSLFRPGAELQRLIDDGTIAWLPGTVRTVSKAANRELEVDSGDGAARRFQKVFLCAGAIGSSAVLLRSLGLADHDVTIHDNEMYNFPILYFGAKGRPFTDHFPISATVVGLENAAGDSVDEGHLLLAPLPSLTFDYYVPKRFADLGRGLIRLLQGRFLIGQMYVDGTTAARYALRVDSEGAVAIRNVQHGESDLRARRLIGTLRRKLRGTHFTPLPFPLIRVSSSFHYVGGFPFGNEHLPLDERCEVFPGLYACDSVVFPGSPVQPLTFTIMANAMRVATLAMG